MTTKAAPKARRSIEDVKRILARPLELVLDDAVAYWLENNEGQRLSPEASRTLGPFARALELHRTGMDPGRMLLCARLETGERYEVGGRLPLIDMAEAAAGIPRRPRRAST